MHVCVNIFVSTVISFGRGFLLKFVVHFTLIWKSFDQFPIPLAFLWVIQNIYWSKSLYLLKLKFNKRDKETCIQVFQGDGVKLAHLWRMSAFQNPIYYQSRVGIFYMLNAILLNRKWCCVPQWYINFNLWPCTANVRLFHTVS